jgi:hypothetical protein
MADNPILVSLWGTGHHRGELRDVALRFIAFRDLLLRGVFDTYRSPFGKFMNTYQKSVSVWSPSELKPFMKSFSRSVNLAFTMLENFRRIAGSHPSKSVTETLLVCFSDSIFDGVDKHPEVLLALANKIEHTLKSVRFSKTMNASDLPTKVQARYAMIQQDIETVLGKKFKDLERVTSPS